MKSLYLVLACIACVSSSADAGSIAAPGDFYLISRDRYGLFVGSHKLFVEYSAGLEKVAYCDRPYYVRSHSVAWTQMEAERGHIIQIEYNFGRGWRPICANPQSQVTLSDIGIKDTPMDVLAENYGDTGGNGRLSAIGTGFGDSEATTYHAK